ncbi:hypothetical protein CHX26_15150 [Porphyrobacter sp. HT-58-2]|uniref:tetratricopeptide repeat protein n=1 Tax=Porphyrobacter sp. HT-58-2 TaxID=2023229 RepID=UPI000CDCCB95|nr:tetratricopeptide repeat protein [Porphyrobacter sp. HT-58-2]AUX70654.1 hypothetical protein CHX26_15150 [Porphyrobacter sp. HT-58-2]
MTSPLRTFTSSSLSFRLAGALLAATTLATVPLAPALAQDSAAEARIRKIEAEIRALQRKVFPGGDGRFFEPQIAPGNESAASPANVSPPATTAVTDILVRLDALELQLQTLTARSEEQANALSQLDARLTLIETAANAPLVAGTAGDVPKIQPSATLPVAAPARAAAAPAPAPAPAPTPAAAAPVAAPAVAAPSPTRLAAVQAITKPQTADAGDDEYSYGFRLWNAGFFPEARQQLTKFVEQYPNHARISFGRNLLGRAFLDDNMPEEAARWFLRNYQANKNADRAPDSLLYLGASMIAMKDTKRACIALAEFAETYPLIASGRLATEYQTNRAKVKCS